MAGAARVVPICESEVPLAQALGPDPRALAVITGTEGPSYRPVGAAMVIDAEGRIWGSLSSGCIERDVALHAGAALADGQRRQLRYGAGSPFADLVLPCGGGLDILILPEPPRPQLSSALSRLRARQAALLDLGPFRLQIEPELRFVIFGKGPEMRAFASFASAADFPVATYSLDAETLAGLANPHLMSRAEWPEGLALDHRTAVALFFHDHDWEPPLLATALKSPALYIGAQGSLRADQARRAALRELGLRNEELARLASPFGLVPSARDARMLAASVLAQVLEQARL